MSAMSTTVPRFDASGLRFDGAASHATEDGAVSYATEDEADAAPATDSGPVAFDDAAWAVVVQQRTQAEVVREAVKESARRGGTIRFEWPDMWAGFEFFEKLNFPPDELPVMSPDGLTGTFTFWAEDAAGIPVRARVTLATDTPDMFVTAGPVVTFAHIPLVLLIEMRAVPVVRVTVLPN